MTHMYILQGHNTRNSRERRKWKKGAKSFSRHLCLSRLRAQAAVGSAGRARTPRRTHWRRPLDLIIASPAPLYIHRVRVHFSLDCADWALKGLRGREREREEKKTRISGALARISIRRHHLECKHRVRPPRGTSVYMYAYLRDYRPISNNNNKAAPAIRRLQMSSRGAFPRFHSDSRTLSDWPFDSLVYVCMPYAKGEARVFWAVECRGVYIYVYARTRLIWIEDEREILCSGWAIYMVHTVMVLIPDYVDPTVGGVKFAIRIMTFSVGFVLFGLVELRVVAEW